MKALLIILVSVLATGCAKNISQSDYRKLSNDNLLNNYKLALENHSSFSLCFEVDQKQAGYSWHTYFLRCIDERAVVRDKLMSEHQMQEYIVSDGYCAREYFYRAHEDEFNTQYLDDDQSERCNAMKDYIELKDKIKNRL